MKKQKQESPVVYSDKNDQEMERAYRRARQTFKFFWREMNWEMRRIIPGLDISCVKIAFSDPPGKANPNHPAVEYMWINQVEFDGASLKGTLMNSPNWVSVVKEGDRVRVRPRWISDWMYAVAGHVYGGHTVNLIRSRMTRAERSEHDAAWGLEFGDPNVIEYVPPEFMGQKRPGLFKKLVGRRQPSRQDPKQLAQLEHPMAMNMLPSLQEFVDQNPDRLSAVDRSGLNILHHHALAGAAAAVDYLLRSGADPIAKTRRGLTAAKLANIVGWRNVEQVIGRHLKGSS